MVQKILLLESGVIRGLLVALVGLVASIVGALGWDSELFSAKADKVVEALAFALQAGGLVYAAWARVALPTPPISNKAAEATEQRAKEGGRVSVPVLVALLVLGVSTLAACTGVRQAYKAAESLDETAYVIAEHYAVTVAEAASLASAPGTPAAAVRAMQAADRRARPAVEALKPLRDAYVASKSAEDAVALQRAVDAAVLALADLVRGVKAAGGAP